MKLTYELDEFMHSKGPESNWTIWKVSSHDLDVLAFVATPTRTTARVEVQ